MLPAAGFTPQQVMEMAALASNAANKDDAIDSAVFRAYATMMNKSVDTAAAEVRACARASARGWCACKGACKCTVHVRAYVHVDRACSRTS